MSVSKLSLSLLIKTVLNTAIIVNPIFREIKQTAIEGETRAVDLSNSEDTAVEGPINRIATECISISITHMTHRIIYISNGDHDDPHEPPQKESEGCDISQNTLYSHQINSPKESDDFGKLLYIYQHFQDSEKMHQIEPESESITSDDDPLYPYVNNDIEYGLFEDIVDSYYLDRQIKDDFQCNHDCYSQYRDRTNDNYSNASSHITKCSRPD